MQTNPLLTKQFEEQLRVTFWAEKTLIKAMPNVIQQATSMELIEALLDHLEESYSHVERLAKVFACIEKKPIAMHCKTIEALIKEAKNTDQYRKNGAMCDAGIISNVQKVEHYEISTYQSLHHLAETLSLSSAVNLLALTLNEECRADEVLSKVAKTINREEITNKISKSNYDNKLRGF